MILPMKSLNFSKKRVLLTTGLLVLASTSMYVFIWFQARPLTAEQLDQKFDCNRITADVRETDIFCRRLAWYNNPEAISIKEFYALYDCGSAKQQNKPQAGTISYYPGSFTTRYDCQNPEKMHQYHQEFIRNLQKLKAKYR